MPLGRSKWRLPLVSPRKRLVFMMRIRPLSCAVPTLCFLMFAAGCTATDPTKTESNSAGGHQASGGASSAPNPGTGGKADDFGSTGGASTSAGGTAGLHAAGGAALGGAASGGQSAKNLLVDDFEDGDGNTLIGGGWYSYTDQPNGGGSVVTISRTDDGSIAMTGEGYQSKLSLKVDYSFTQAALPYTPYIGFGAGLGSVTAPVDWSQYAGISYTYKGGKHRIRVETLDIADYDFWGMEIPAATSWTTIDIPFTQMTQEGFGKVVPFDPHKVGAISYQTRGNTGESGTVLIDNLTVLANLAKALPDLSLADPASPNDVVATGEITNPLQAKALKYLSRGYNITNWLESARFSGFTYDEKFVASLAAAGFKSLRLPIDLDLYIDRKATPTGSTDLVLSDDLFLILDSFDRWTKSNGLSLTIDYHQYDKSLDITKPASVAEVVQLWSKVAQHFSANTREDLFYELMNEPELSIGSRAPTQAEWTTITEQMIAAIRAQDTTHTLIFGDVEWYGITPLTRREPLSDKNVIYAFHYYEPFIFTHQGASWANMASSHDIPYPYTKDRWTEYSTEFGFTQFTDSWILDQARSYYQVGNRATIRNRIYEARHWGVDHNLPVICNEFGVYDRTSRLEDRTRYYTDLIGIFEEFGIPWQHWFMIMSASGAVVPEYQAAFGLMK